MSNPPFEINLQASRQQIGSIENAQLLYVYVDIRTPQNASVSERVPLNISLVVDRSTSMRGERLKRVKAAANLVIDKLAPDDTLSIISYSDRAEVVVPATKAHNKTPFMAKTRGIIASGGTEIYQGLFAGLRELRKSPLDQHVNHLILLTDGHTYGDVDKCLDLAEKAAGRGIGLSAFGIGSEWNDEFLDALVAPSGGQSGFISEPEQIIHFLRERINGLGAVYAQNVYLEVDVPEIVEIKEAFKLSPFAQPLTFTMRQLQLGAIEGTIPLSLLLELVIEPPVPIGRVLEIALNFGANIPSREPHEQAMQRTLNLTVVEQPGEPRMPDDILTAVQLLNLYRMNEQVWKEVESGEVDAATQRMEWLTTRFKEAGLTQLAQQANSETRRLAHTGTLSLEGRKALKYGTRTMLTSSLNFNLGDSQNGTDEL